MTPEELLDRLLERLGPPYNSNDLMEFLDKVEDRFLEIKKHGYSLTDAIVDVLEDRA